MRFKRIATVATTSRSRVFAVAGWIVRGLLAGLVVAGAKAAGESWGTWALLATLLVGLAAVYVLGRLYVRMLWRQEVSPGPWEPPLI